jgi:hypothetical protein
MELSQVLQVPWRSGVSFPLAFALVVPPDPARSCLSPLKADEVLAGVARADVSPKRAVSFPRNGPG